MTRIPAHTTEDAPEAARELLADMVQFSPTGRLLNLHAQMAHSPAVLESYVSIRRATGTHGALDQRLRTGLMLATAATADSEYALAIITLLAQRAGWQPGQIAALRSGAEVGESRADALIAVVREAAADCGRVSDAAWDHAVAAGCTDEDLAEAFAYLGLTVFTAYFFNYADTEPDVPAGPQVSTVAAGQGSA